MTWTKLENIMVSERIKGHLYDSIDTTSSKRQSSRDDINPQIAKSPRQCEIPKQAKPQRQSISGS